MLVWTDIETTGLRPEDKILEIAVGVTDDNLELVGEIWSMVVRQPVDLLTIDPKVVQMHSVNGLWADVAASKYDLLEARTGFINTVKRYNAAGKDTPLCGNCVHSDRAWLQRWIPEVLDHLSYRILDVDSLKSAALRWRPSLLNKMPCSSKDSVHRAAKDVELAIAQAKYFKAELF